MESLLRKCKCSSFHPYFDMISAGGRMTQEGIMIMTMTRVGVTLSPVGIKPIFGLKLKNANSFSLLQEATRGVGFWLFMTVLALLVHLAWIPVPFLFNWAQEWMVAEVTTLGLVALFIIYFISVVSSYKKRVELRDQDMRSKRRLI